VQIVALVTILGHLKGNPPSRQVSGKSHSIERPNDGRGGPERGQSSWVSARNPRGRRYWPCDALQPNLAAALPLIAGCFCARVRYTRNEAGPIASK
jgi:hypothetical protein